MTTRSKRKQRRTPPASSPGNRAALSPEVALYLRELPAVIRKNRAHVADVPNALRHLADLLDASIHELSTDAPADRIEAAYVQIRSGTAAANALLFDLAVFAGRLAELARGVAATESVESQA